MTSLGAPGRSESRSSIIIICQEDHRILRQRKHDHFPSVIINCKPLFCIFMIDYDCSLHIMMIDYDCSLHIMIQEDQHPPLAFCSSIGAAMTSKKSGIGSSSTPKLVTFQLDLRQCEKTTIPVRVCRQQYYSSCMVIHQDLSRSLEPVGYGHPLKIITGLESYLFKQFLILDNHFQQQNPCRYMISLNLFDYY